MREGHAADARTCIRGEETAEQALNIARITSTQLSAPSQRPQAAAGAASLGRLLRLP